MSCLDGCIDPCAPTPCVEACNCTTNEVIYNGPNDTCLGIAYNDRLTDVLTAFGAFAKNRLYNIVSSTSVLVTPILSNCNKSAQVTAIISPDADNIITIHANGLYATAPVPDEPLVDCTTVSAVFVTDTAQKNTIVQTAYDYLITGSAGCQKLSPPTGFAVTGNTRVSAFGNMEWYATLVLANAAAVAGETVLIYNDTVEALVVKDNVNYFGVGQHSVDTLSAALTSNSVTVISNITVTNNIASSGTGRVITHNVICLGSVAFAGSVRWEGGSWLDNTGTHAFNLSVSAHATGIYSKIETTILNNARLSNSVIEDTSPAVGSFAVTIYNGVISSNIAMLENCVVSSANNGGIFALANQGDGGMIVSNNTCTTNLEIALYVHTGGVSADSTTVVSHNTVNNFGIVSAGLTTGCAMVIYSVALGVGVPQARISNIVISDNNVHSVDGVGIKSILGTMKSCNAYSENNYAIYIHSAENQTFGTGIINCTAESKNSNALRADRDVFIVGGTYITRWDDVTAAPILLGVSAFNQNGPVLNYYISDVTTITTNTTAYAIDSLTAVTARISGCHFLNEHLVIGIPGINLGQITVASVATDVYGNIS